VPTTAAAAVTIVVITRDRAADLERTIPRHARFPVIVVDNGSQDASAAVAEPAPLTSPSPTTTAGGSRAASTGPWPSSTRTQASRC